METITLTFGDCGENHVGMQKIGLNEKKGFSLEELKEIKNYFDKKHVTTELIDLGIENDMKKKEEAYVLVIRQGVQILLSKRHWKIEELFQEQKDLKWDTKAFMYGRVVNKHARHNICFGENSQEPCYEEKKGRIVAFKEVEKTRYLRKKLRKISKRTNLIGEGNRYYDVRKCGIGYHGDAERSVVIGCRLGAEMPLHFNWFYQNEPKGENMKIILNNGDIYFMSAKAVGSDWKKRSIYTLRHSAGSKKYTTL